MEKEIVFDYDEENDILWIHRKEKIKGSIDVADFIVDISTDEKVIGLEIPTRGVGWLHTSGLLGYL